MANNRMFVVCAVCLPAAAHLSGAGELKIDPWPVGNAMGTSGALAIGKYYPSVRFTAIGDHVVARWGLNANANEFNEFMTQHEHGKADATGPTHFYLGYEHPRP